MSPPVASTTATTNETVLGPTPTPTVRTVASRPIEDPPAGPSTPRFTNESVLTGALRELAQFVASEKARQKHPLTCPHRLGCAPSDCPQAFECGVLPNSKSGRRHILFWTLACAGGMSAFLSLLFTMFYVVAPPDAGDRPTNYLMLGLGLMPLPLVAGLIGFGYASFSSRWQQGHIRALATATNSAGLHFLSLVPVPARLADYSFPVISPTPPKYGMLMGDVPRAVVKLAGAGELDGNEVVLAQFMCHFDPNDYLPLGGVIKFAQTIAKPGSVAARPEIWRMYVLTLFPAYLARTPDFLIQPIERDFETYFAQREFSSRLAKLPERGHLGKYLLAMADPKLQRSLGSELFDLLARSPGWSIQVVGGRLMVWKGGCNPNWRFQLPQSGERIVELLQFAKQVRQILSRQALVGEYTS